MNMRLILEKAVGTTKKTKYTKNQRLTDRVPLTNRVMVTIVLTPSFFVCFVVVICRFTVEASTNLSASSARQARFLYRYFIFFVDTLR